MKDLEKYVGTTVAVSYGVNRLCVGYSNSGGRGGYLILESDEQYGWKNLDMDDTVVSACEYYEYVATEHVSDPVIDKPVPTIQASINDLEASGYIITRVDNGFTVRHPNGSQTFHEQLSERLC